MLTCGAKGSGVMRRFNLWQGSRVKGWHSPPPPETPRHPLGTTHKLTDPNAEFAIFRWRQRHWPAKKKRNTKFSHIFQRIFNQLHLKWSNFTKFVFFFIIMIIKMKIVLEHCFFEKFHQTLFSPFFNQSTGWLRAPKSDPLGTGSPLGKSSSGMLTPKRDVSLG